MNWSPTPYLALALCLFLGPVGRELQAQTSQAATNKTPNVIFFVMDDLNDWVSPLGYTQAVTPNLDRLARQGTLFRNAHAPGVFCAPSRTAIFTGLQATTTGCYDTEVFFHDQPDLVSLQMAFQQAGYATYGAGKLYHHRSGYVDLRGWDQYFTRSQEVRDMAYEMNPYHQSDVPLPDPYPYSPYYRQGGREGGSALHLEWGPIDNAQEDKMADALRTNWMCDRIGRTYDKPFFMALGMYSPHFPHYAPQKYFDLYDRDSLEIPPYKEDDLEDLSPELRKRMENRKKQHEELVGYGALKDALHGYLAAISFGDAMLGRVLDALEASPHKDNTIIVFWSDQGYHLGEKGHWGKSTLWQRTSHVPFIWAGPGIARDENVDTTVSLIDMYPTLVDLCNLPIKREFDGVSLATALQDPSQAVERDVFIPHSDQKSYAVINSKWRYIYNKDGSEELYNQVTDPNEWTNLAGIPEYAPLIEKMKTSAPAVFAPIATARNTLDLVVEGDRFRWVPKKKK